MWSGELFYNGVRSFDRRTVFWVPGMNCGSNFANNCNYDESADYRVAMSPRPFICPLDQGLDVCYKPFLQLGFPQMPSLSLNRE